MNEDDTTINFTREELEGVPEDFLSSLKKEEKDGKTSFVLTMKYPDLFGVLKKAKASDTRKRMQIAYASKCKNNIPLLEEVSLLPLFTLSSSIPIPLGT